MQSASSDIDKWANRSSLHRQRCIPQSCSHRQSGSIQQIWLLLVFTFAHKSARLDEVPSIRQSPPISGN